MVTKARPKPKSLHYHACDHCQARYPDNCAQPLVNKICNTCRSGRQSVHAKGCAPQPCCRTTSRIANKADLKTYRLRGGVPWWICMTCCRTHAFNPRTRA